MIIKSSELSEDDMEYCKEAVMSNEYFDFIVETSKSLSELEMFGPVICEQKLWTKYTVLTVSQNKSQELTIKNYGYNTIPKCYGLLDINTLESAGILKIRRQPYINVFGSGVLIGFIDTGIAYTNELFRHGDGTTRIVSIWDQTITGGVPPEGFYAGTQYMKEEIDDALKSQNPYEIVPSKDEDGHGTALASIAAGGIDEKNEFSGVAPMSSIVVVKLKEAKPYLKEFHGIYNDVPCYQENDIMLGIQYLLNVATKMKMPLVICLALGTNSGDHNGNSVLGDFINVTGDYTGISIVTGTGNEANVGHHYRKDILDTIKPEKMEFRVGENEKGFSLEIWGTVPNRFSLSILSPTGELVPRIPARLDFSQSVSLVLERTKIFIDYRIIEERTGDELVFIRFTDPSPGIWTINLYSDTGPQTLDAWLPMRNFISENTYFLNADPFITITEPSNALTPVTVATYDHTSDSINLNSGRGNTRDGRRKPDITAPGVNVFVATPNGGYTSMTGSSIATAILAGTAVLIFEWAIIQGKRTSLNYISVKQFLIIGADREEDMEYPNPIWGYGTLDLYQSFERLRQ